MYKTTMILTGKRVTSVDAAAACDGYIEQFSETTIARRNIHDYESSDGVGFRLTLVSESEGLLDMSGRESVIDKQDRLYLDQVLIDPVPDPELEVGENPENTEH